jgi:hypothetical protein
MNGHRGWAAVALAAIVVVGISGCQGTVRSRRAIASTEPGLSLSDDSGMAIAEAPPVAAPPRGVTVVDRHPLFSKPRDYYEGAGNNRIVKAGAAVIVGIPAGVVGELRQIAVGRPPGSPR